MTLLEAIAARANEFHNTHVSPEQVQALIEALAADSDLRLLFRAEVDRLRDSSRG